MAVPDNARQRFLNRLGWRSGIDSSNRGRAETLAFLEQLAREVAAPLGEVNQVIEAFAGAGDEATRPAACCLAAPRCSQCPVNTHCAYYKAEGKRADAASRSFAATTRREQRPRERLQREGAEALMDEELLAIVLRTGSGRENALDLARRILRHAGTLERVATMSIAELSRFHGLGRVKAITVKAALEMARRVRDTTGFSESGRLDAAKKVFELLRPQFVGCRKEEFHVLLLNTKLEMTRQVRVSTGTLNQSLVHPREVFTEAVRDSAYAVIFVHNHPSGDPEPSRDDFAVTAKLVKAGEVMGVRVLDHIIMGRDAFFSFAEEGKLNA